MPNQDIIVGGSDSMVRIFTRSPERVGPTALVKAYEEQLAQQSVPSNQVGDVDKTKLPGLDALNKQGSKDGQVLMVRAGALVEAHQWSASEARWIKIGEVVDAIGSSRKQVFDGKEYDYVFDVDVQEGVPPLKLPYNASDNPYQAAQDFIEKNDLDPSFLDQVANFITQNAKPITLGGEENASGFADPFTGGNRYVPGGSVSNHQPQQAPNASGAASSLIPMQEFTFIKTANLKAILSKLAQLNSEMGAEVALDASEMSILGNIVSKLESNGVSQEFGQDECSVMYKVCLSWPETVRFPGKLVCKSLDIPRL
jgi:phospholipase A-2-activating protein